MRVDSTVPASLTGPGGIRADDGGIGAGGIGAGGIGGEGIGGGATLAKVVGADIGDIMGAVGREGTPADIGARALRLFSDSVAGCIDATGVRSRGATCAFNRLTNAATPLDVAISIPSSRAASSTASANSAAVA